MKPDEKMEMQALGPCVCGKKIFAAKEDLAVMHEAPVCQKYIDLGPVEFLAYVRRSRGISDAEAGVL